MAAAPDRGGPVWLLKIQIQDEQTEALVDTGASRSFVVPSMVAELKLPTEEMDVGARLRVASGSKLVVRSVGRKAKFRSGDLETWADLLVVPLPCQIFLGTNWLCRKLVVWDFGHCRLKVQGDNVEMELPVVESLTATDPEKALPHKDDSFNVNRQQADEPRRLLVEDVERLGRDDAAALVRPAPKRYKNFRTRKKLVPIKIVKAIQER